MTSWIPLATVAECPPGASLERVVEGRIIALFHAAGQIHALDGVCPHQGGPLGKGLLTGCVVTCPWHGWQFDVRSGQNPLSENVRQPVFSVKIEGEEILVQLNDEDAAEP